VSGVLVLSRRDLEKAVSMREAIEAVEKAFLALYRGEVKQPLRSIVEAAGGYVLNMPCYYPAAKSFTVKTVSVFEENLRRGLPTIFATVLLIDPETGMPLAVMEGGYLTALRTGAATGVATKYLAREDSEVLAIVGAGFQAPFQAKAVMEVRGIRRVLIYDISRERSEGLAEELRRLGVEARAAGSCREAVEQADVVVLATTAREPAISGDWVKPGTHLNSIGWMGTDARELDTKTVLMSKLVVDSREAVLAESGDILIPIREGAMSEEHIYAEIGEVIAGEKPGRESEREVTLWKSVGQAVQDAAVAKLAYERAAEAKLGVEVEL